LVTVGAGLPTPVGIELAASAEAQPAVRASLHFAADVEAALFEAGWPDIKRRWRGTVGLVGLGAMLDGLVVKRTGFDVEIEGRIAESQMRLAMSVVKALLPPPPPV